MVVPSFKLAGMVLSCRDARRLAGFYEALLGWRRTSDEDGWVILRDDDRTAGLSFHVDECYVPPEWPSMAGEQLMMAHLDVAVDDLDGAVARACELGATLADAQPQDDVRVLLDPEGHPICLFEAADWIHGDGA